MIAMLFLFKSGSCQELLLNNNFAKLNYCKEYNKPCAFIGWYQIGYNTTPVKLKNKQLALEFVPVVNRYNQYKTYLIGSLVKQLNKGSKVNLDFEILNPREVTIAVGFLKNFEFDSSVDFQKIDSMPFFEFKASKRNHQKFSVTVSDTVQFIAIYIVDSSTTPLNILSISAKLTRDGIQNEFQINYERLNFILNDNRRHNFTNTISGLELLNSR
ncbi:MAG: hypothetical protein FGM41_12145 [Bacteroidetes bacterium]|nr:hypothetical protein [Bacteroidota bacterium]